MHSVDQPAIVPQMTKIRLLVRPSDYRDRNVAAQPVVEADKGRSGQIGPSRRRGGASFARHFPAPLLRRNSSASHPQTSSSLELALISPVPSRGARRLMLDFACSRLRARAVLAPAA